MFYHLKNENEKTGMFEYFIEAIYPPVLLALGLFGNMMSFAVFSRKRMANLSFRNIGRIMAIADIIYLLQLPEDYLTYHLKVNVRNMSVYSCKILRYFNFCLGPIPAWLLVYICYDRALSTVYPGKFLIFKTRSFKVLYVTFIIVFNLIFYVPVMLYHDKIHLKNNTKDDLDCYFVEKNKAFIVVNMDLINSTIIPFILMTISSALIIHKLVKIRRKISRKKTFKRKNKTRKDIRFSITSILLNFMFFVFNFPICLIQFVPSYLYCLSSLYLFYSSYAINFYIFFFFNSVFRREVMLMLHLKVRENYSEYTYKKHTVTRSVYKDY